MKKKIFSTLLTLSFLASIPFSCRKSMTDLSAEHPLSNDSTQNNSSSSSASNQPVPYPQSPLLDCTFGPYYGDTLVYAQPSTGQDYIISPVNNPGKGSYYSWPDGLKLNPVTGAIDLTQSEKGERYAIGFVKAGTKDTCVSYLIVGGASYMDSIYVFANNEKKAAPFFNANPAMPTICNGSGVSGPGCAFDVNGTALAQKVIVDPNTGVIDLEKTLNGGAFGLLPLNGQTVITTIYYQLNDGSNNALQHIQVELMYYDKKSNIGAGLLNNVLMKLNNILSGNLIQTAGNPRPPLIIITRLN
ncbi:MAG: hypothetical protein C5B59_17505 [Bacteroidetes bacterium]|nr:MAG: hypothetical protein C5B59_17505 [Bacteroidota bacterium]